MTTRLHKVKKNSCALAKWISQINENKHVQFQQASDLNAPKRTPRWKGTHDLVISFQFQHPVALNTLALIVRVLLSHRARKSRVYLVFTRFAGISRRLVQ